MLRLPAPPSIEELFLTVKLLISELPAPNWSFKWSVVISFKDTWPAPPSRLKFVKELPVGR